jgi:hypothetical protein
MIRTRKIIKQYGLPRSGTNYIKCFIEKNYFVRVLSNFNDCGHALSWKHGKYVPTTLDCFATIKDPYSWIVSFYKYTKSKWASWVKPPWKIEESKLQSLDQFVTSECVMCPYGVQVADDEFVDCEPQAYKTPIDYWNDMVDNWSKHVLVFRFEDLLGDFRYDAIERYRKNQQAETIKQVVLPGYEQSVLSNDLFDFGYYKEKQFMDSLSRQAIKIINDTVRLDLMTKFGYDIC